MARSTIPERERFSLVKRAESFTYAGRGLWVFIRSTHNLWIHIFILVCVAVLGIFFHITRTDWMMIVFASGFVLTAEAFNTAIEIDIDLTSPEYHPYAKDTKDVAAGAVLLSAITAALIGAIVFVPYLMGLIH